MLISKHITKIIVITVLLIVGILSYQQEVNSATALKKELEREPKLVPKLKNLDREIIPEELLTLNTNPKSNVKEGDIRGNLFGKFFYDRAEFYVIENPQNKIYTSATESITLFYLDGELCQTKYELESNISSYLIKDLGNFSIKGLNLKNRKIIEDGQTIFKEGKGIVLNKEFDNYQLKWTFGDKEIIYRVNSGDDYTKFEYLEKKKNYEEAFNAIERNTY